MPSDRVLPRLNRWTVPVRQFQVSIGRLMVLVVFVAVAVAELKKLTGWGPNATYTLIIRVILSVTVGVNLSRGTVRVF